MPPSICIAYRVIAYCAFAPRHCHHSHGRLCAGAYYNFNKWAGNLMPGREWSPRTDPSRSPEALLARTAASLRAAGVRIGYMQLDDWYYGGVVYEGAVTCVRDWAARRDWFPRGLRSFSARAQVPLLLYLPYLCNDTALGAKYPLAVEPPSRAKLGGVADPPYPSSHGCAWPQNRTCAGRFALPVPHASAAFYADLFAAAQAEGMVSFEHDFVGQDATNFGWDRSLGSGSAWLQGMGRAAAERRVPMQLCLATGSDLLESLSMPWVTNARASGDYAFCADSWDIGFASMLHWAVGVRPFKDVMWTTSHQPGSPYENTTLLPSMYRRCLDRHGRHAQPNVQLDALFSAFSTGPVGVGDGDGFTDAALALATCRADGRLLPPAKPLTPLDRSWGAAAEAGWLVGSYSAPAGGGGAAADGGDRPSAAGEDELSPLLWQYVVAIDTPCGSAPPLNVARDLYWPPPPVNASTRELARVEVRPRARQFAMHRWGTACRQGEPAYEPSSCVALVGGATADFTMCTTPGSKFANGTHSWALSTLAPLLPGAGWVLLGERDKFVGVSANRFAAVDGSDAAVLRFEVFGMTGEVVHVLAVTPPPKATVVAATATLTAPHVLCSIDQQSASMVCCVLSASADAKGAAEAC